MTATNHLYLTYTQIAHLCGVGKQTAVGIAYLNDCKRYTSKTRGRPAYRVEFARDVLEALNVDFSRISKSDMKIAEEFRPEDEGEVCPEPKVIPSFTWKARVEISDDRIYFLSYQQIARLLGKSYPLAIEVAFVNGCTRHFDQGGNLFLVEISGRLLSKLGANIDLLSGVEKRTALKFRPSDNGEPCPTYGIKIARKWTVASASSASDLNNEPTSVEDASVEELPEAPLATSLNEEDGSKPRMESDSDVIVEVTRIFQGRIRELEERNRLLEKVLVANRIDPDKPFLVPSWNARAV